MSTMAAPARGAPRRPARDCGREGLRGDVMTVATTAALAAALRRPKLGTIARRSERRAAGPGADHPVAVLPLAAAVVVAGCGSFTPIAGWAADVPADVLEDLYRRCGAVRPGAGPPSKATIWRVVTGADTAAFRRGGRRLAARTGRCCRGSGRRR
jgi:hypothetical protein